MNRKTGAVLALVAIFLLGGLAGGMLHNLYRNRVAPPADAGLQAIPRPGDIVEEMARSLGLDDGQKQELKRIFERSREKYRALALQFRPQYDALRKGTDEEIRQLLRDDQAAVYDRLLKEGRERRKLPPPSAGGPNRGMPPSPPPPPNYRD